MSKQAVTAESHMLEFANADSMSAINWNTTSDIVKMRLKE
jgi:hypothetical protein